MLSNIGRVFFPGSLGKALLFEPHVREVRRIMWNRREMGELRSVNWRQYGRNSLKCSWDSYLSC